MFAILISEENIPAIREHQAQLPNQADAHIHYDAYLNNKFDWYYISGFVDPKGKFVAWAAFPESILKQEFEYDPIKILTDWDQIVRL